MLDHDTDSYQKISHAFVDKEPTGNLTHDHVLDNITTYWLTGTGASAARSYWESGQLQAQSAGQAPPPVTIPVGFSQFPDEIFLAPRAGPSRHTRPSATSTKRPGAATSPLGRAADLLRGDAGHVRPVALAHTGDGAAAPSPSR